MTGAGATRPRLTTWTPQLVALLVVSAALWSWLLGNAASLSSGMDMPGGMEMSGGSSAGTMGLALPAFLGMWALMMAAMMLPSVAPVATLYARTVTHHRQVRLVVFTATYLAVWAASALPGWLVLRLVDERATGDTARTVIASVVFLSVGVWQLSPLKQRCLHHCRSPLAQLVHYGAVSGRFRDVRVATHHAAYCLGCCWGLMAIFVVTGAMNVLAMVVLAGVIAAEKLTPRGELVAYATGAAALVAAVAVWWFPGLAPALA